MAAALQAVGGLLPPARNAGHGLPTGPEVYAGIRQYLADARELLGDDGETYKKAIVDRYPSHVGPFIIDIANRSLFGAGH